MKLPLEIAYRNVKHTADIDALIQRKAAKLEEVCPYLTSCRVTIEQPQHFQDSGNAYLVRIEVHVPPKHDIVVKNKSGKRDMHDPLAKILRDTFQATRRRLQVLVEKQRRDVKFHAFQQVTAWIEKLFPAEGYGFLRTIDGRELYFHRNSVLHDDFDQLQAGAGVRFVEESGENGPQASTVELEDRRRQLLLNADDIAADAEGRDRQSAA